jgi:hypothetical protein
MNKPSLMFRQTLQFPFPGWVNPGVSRGTLCRSDMRRHIHIRDHPDTARCIHPEDGQTQLSSNRREIFIPLRGKTLKIDSTYTFCTVWTLVQMPPALLSPYLYRPTVRKIPRFPSFRRRIWFRMCGWHNWQDMKLIPLTDTILLVKCCSECLWGQVLHNGRQKKGPYLYMCYTPIVKLAISWSRQISAHSVNWLLRLSISRTGQELVHFMNWVALTAAHFMKWLVAGRNIRLCSRAFEDLILGAKRLV